MSDLLATLKAGKLNCCEINFPGTDKKVRLVVLSTQDTLDASLAADRLFAQEKIVPAFHNINTFENEKTTQMLFRALRDPETGDPVTQNISEFRRMLTNEERNALIEEYNVLAERCNPSPIEMPADEFDALIENVKKNPLETIGNISSLQTLKRLSLFLAEGLANLQKDNGSTS
jgi:hypothetical protein